jgi:hypothetical protein
MKFALIALFSVFALHALQAQEPKSKVDWKFLSVGAIYAGVTVADIELTQRCIHAGTCYEANPMMPSSRAGAYAVVAATDGLKHGLHTNCTRPTGALGSCCQWRALPRILTD